MAPMTAYEIVIELHGMWSILTIREAYNQLFGEAIAEYNAKQKRKDRQVTDYLKDIKNSGNGEKQFYEIVVQIGKRMMQVSWIQREIYLWTQKQQVKY